VGDFNGDGISDLVSVGNTSNGAASVRMGIGNGTFGSPILYDIGGAYAIAVDDINEDGWTDIVIPLYSSSSMVSLLNNGDGSFHKVIRWEADGPFPVGSQFAAALSDFNADGTLDVVIGRDPDYVGLWLGRGNGVYAFNSLYNSIGSATTSVVTADFNGDGRADIAAAAAFDRVNVLLGTTSACCRLSVDRTSTIKGVITSSPAGIHCGIITGCSATFSMGQVVNLTAVADPGETQYFSGWQGDPDCADGIVTLNTSVYCEARFDLAQPNLTRTRGDFNADGRSDILWQHSSGSASVWIMNGWTPVQAAGLPDTGTGWTIQQLGDFNRDGKTDILFQHTDGRVSEWVMNGTNLGSGSLILGSGTGWTITAVGDLDGDNRSDILWQHSGGTVSVGYGGGGPTSGRTLRGAGTSWSVLHIADFNNDGISDVLWQHTDGSSELWLFSAGMNGAITPQSLLGPGTGWSAKLAADLDGDGKSDIVWQHTDGSAAIWLMSGTALKAAAGVLGPSTGWHVYRSGDFNGDGNGDILWQHGDGRIAIWLMNGALMADAALVLGPGTGWNPIRIGDFDGDGKSDVLWQHSGGSVAMWLMNGLTVNGAAGLLGPSTGWSPVP